MEEILATHHGKQRCGKRMEKVIGIKFTETSRRVKAEKCALHGLGKPEVTCDFLESKWNQWYEPARVSYGES